MNLAVQQKVMVEVNRALSAEKFQQYQAEIDSLVDRCRKFKIKDPDTKGIAIDMLSQIRGLENRLDDARKEVVEESTTYSNLVNEKVRGWLHPLRQETDHKVPGSLADKVKTYLRVTEQARREAEEKARIEAAKLQEKINRQAEKKGITPIEIPRPIVPKPSNVSQGKTVGKAAGRKTWKARLTDIKALAKEVIDGNAPEELLAFNQSFANDLARHSKGSRSILGIEFYEDEGLSIFAA